MMIKSFAIIVQFDRSYAFLNLCETELTLPYQNDNVYITYTYPRIVFHHGHSYTITWIDSQFVMIRLDSVTYGNQVKGLCSNYNNYALDDIVSRDDFTFSEKMWPANINMHLWVENWHFQTGLTVCHEPIHTYNNITLDITHNITGANAALIKETDELCSILYTFGLCNKLAIEIFVH